MDGRKNPVSVSSHDGPIDANSVPVALDVHPRAIPDDDIVARDPIEGPIIENQTIVFCGDQQQVNEGFAMALRVMGFDAGFLRGEIPPTATHPNRETTK
jgi:hypothetical protein